jgi:hypothetical protein
MCLIIASTKGFAHLDYGLVDDIYCHNPDGFGFMYADNGKLVQFKGLPLPGAIWTVLQNLPDDRMVAVHFRQTTHGKTDLGNAHPHPVLKLPGYRLYLMHNGILACGNAADRSISDTKHFIRDEIRPRLARNPYSWRSRSFRKAILPLLGSSNKLLLMDSNGKHSILNRDTGVVIDGIWYSNTYAWNPYLLEGYKPKYAAYDYTDSQWYPELELENERWSKFREWLDTENRRKFKDWIDDENRLEYTPSLHDIEE